MKYIYDKMCRLCLNTSNTLLPIFNGDTIVQAIVTCTNIKVIRRDGYPENICYNCNERLKDAFTFKQQCENSDFLLKQSNDKYISSIPDNSSEIEVNKIKFNYERNIDEQFEVIYETEEYQESFTQIEFIKLERNDEIDETFERIYEENNTDGCKNDLENNPEVTEKYLDEFESCENNELVIDESYGEEKDLKLYNNSYEAKNEKCKEKGVKEEFEPDHVAALECSIDYNKLECSICHKTFSSQSNLKRHFKAHADFKPYKCSECDKAFDFLFKLKKHIDIHGQGDSRRVECKICYKSYSHNGNLSKHIKIHHTDNPFKCPTCQKEFRHANTLQYHMDLHLPEDAEPHKCTECDFSTRKLAALHKHIAITHKENIPKSYRRTTVPVTCTVCDKVLSSKMTLKFHMKIHRKKEYVCRFCGKDFVFKNSLDAHERIHLDLKPFKCNVCDKSFRQRMGLHIHKRVHTGEKPYQCQVCCKSFTQASHLKSHLLTHTREKNFECNICSKKFALNESLRYHKMTHTGELRHRCYICDRGFIIAYKLKIHLKKSHNIEITTEQIKEKNVPI